MKFLYKLTKNEARLQRLIGLKLDQLDLLERSIRLLWKRAEKERLNRRNRRRKIGGGRHYKFKTIKEKIIVVLLYYKQYPTQELLGVILGVDQSAISRILQRMLPLIELAADVQLKTYLIQAKEFCQSNRISSWQAICSQYPDLIDISTDSTEQPCYRAKNYEKQKQHYSGKSKQHVIKTQISVSSTGRALDISQSYPGSMHDKLIIDTEKTVEKFHQKVPQRFDSGYQGIRSQYPDHYVILPLKKPRGKELSKLAKEHNKSNSKRRVIVEHVFSRMKKFKITAEPFRQPLLTHNQIVRNVVAILNFKLQNSPPII